MKLLLFLLFQISLNFAAYSSCSKTSGFLELSATALNGTTVKFDSVFRNRVTLVVNVAGYDDSTEVNYLQLNQLYSKYAAKGFRIAAFPCDQFFWREPESNNEILDTLYYVRPGNSFIPKFKSTIFQIGAVNGAESNPVYKLLLPACPNPIKTIHSSNEGKIVWTPISKNDISWNFEKILLDKNSVPFKRYDPSTLPLEIEKDIATLLAQ